MQRFLTGPDQLCIWCTLPCPADIAVWQGKRRAAPHCCDHPGSRPDSGGPGRPHPKVPGEPCRLCFSVLHTAHKIPRSFAGPRACQGVLRCRPLRRQHGAANTAAVRPPKSRGPGIRPARAPAPSLCDRGTVLPCLPVHPRQVTRVPADKLVDTNGAGDAFVGGFLSQLVRQHSPVSHVPLHCG